MHAQRYFVLFIRKIAIPLDKNCIFVYNNDKYCKLHEVFFAILTYNNEQMKTKKTEKEVHKKMPWENPTTFWISTIVVALVCIVVGVLVGVLYRKKVAERIIGSAEQKAKSLVEEGTKQAASAQKEALLSAKEEIMRQRNDFEREMKERRNEVSRTESRLAKKEETLEKKTEQVEHKSEQLDKKIKENEQFRELIAEQLKMQMNKLETIAGYSAEQAKEELVARVENEAKEEIARRLEELEAQYKEDAEEKARDIITLAIQRYASDQVAEVTISTVALPNDDMKGRIIGREGRNIQQLEKLTGVELIVDDTPETIILSGFDPVRREVARLALEKLISDGRIHPTRIEEMVEKAKREVDTAVKQAGERAIYEVGVRNLNPELIRLLGRLRYRTSYGQNVLKHSIEVAFLAGVMAEELGVDATLARRAGLLHDIGKAFPQDVEGTHVQIGVNAVKKYKESREVVHAIEAHHNDVEPKTVIAFLVQAADAISAARPGARREDMDNYIKRLEKIEEIAKSFGGVDKAYAIQAGREIRVMVNPETVSDDNMKIVAREMAEKIQNEVQYPGQIKINIIRESRVVDYAK